MAGALMASGTASAAVFWFGTFDQFVGAGPITDGDNDMQFNSTVLPSLSGDLVGKGQWIDVVLKEVEIAGVDLYTVSFDFNITDNNPLNPFFASGGYVGTGGDFEYSLTALVSNEWINSARLDTDVEGGLPTTNVTKDLYDIDFTNGHFLTLTSTNGQQDPLVGHTHFDKRHTVYVKDTLNSGGGIITHVDNQFDVPEPMTLSLIGMGLAAFGARRRFA